MIYSGTSYHDDLLHDLSIDQNVFGHQDMSSLKIGTALLIEQSHAVLASYTLKLIYYVGCEQRLCEEAVYTGMDRFFHDLIPVK